MRKDEHFARTWYRHHILRFSYTHTIFDHALIDPAVIEAKGPPKNKAFSHHCRAIWQSSAFPVNKESKKKVTVRRRDMNPGIKNTETNESQELWVTSPKTK